MLVEISRPEQENARADDDDGDVDNVQRNLREGRDAETFVDLENPAEERGAADEDDVGEHDGREPDHQEVVGAKVNEMGDQPEDRFAPPR